MTRDQFIQYWRGLNDELKADGIKLDVGDSQYALYGRLIPQSCIHIFNLKVERQKRGQGVAGYWLDRLCDEVDSNHLALSAFVFNSVPVTPFNYLIRRFNPKFPMGPFELAGFYRRRGFRHVGEWQYYRRAR